RGEPLDEPGHVDRLAHPLRGPLRAFLDGVPRLQPAHDLAADRRYRHEVPRVPAAEHVPVPVRHHGKGRVPRVPHAVSMHSGQSGCRCHGVVAVASPSASSITWYVAAATGGSIRVRYRSTSSDISPHSSCTTGPMARLTGTGAMNGSARSAGASVSTSSARCSSRHCWHGVRPGCTDQYDSVE